MAQKIAFVNNKGGSTKTTTTVNLAGAIHKRKPDSKILIVEGDAQGNATRSFGEDPNNTEVFANTIYDVFMGDITPEEAIYKNIYDGIDILPANNNMNFIEFDKMDQFEDDFKTGVVQVIRALFDQNIDISVLSDEQLLNAMPNIPSPTKNYFNMLDGKFDKLDKEYDFILFDTPPELKAVTSSIIAIADKVVIPYEPDVYSLDGVKNILDRISVIEEDFNPDLSIAGLLATKYKKNTKVHSDVVLGVMAFANARDIPFFSVMIPNTIRFASATAYHGVPATLSKKQNPLIDTYFDLLDEMISKGVIDLEVN